MAEILFELELVQFETSVSLQIYPKLFLASGSMFDSGWWQVLVRCWENTVYNPVVDLQYTWQLLLVFVILVFGLWRLWKFCWNHRWFRRKDKKRRLPGASEERDLEV